MNCALLEIDSYPIMHVHAVDIMSKLDNLLWIAFVALPTNPFDQVRKHLRLRGKKQICKWILAIVLMFEC